MMHYMPQNANVLNAFQPEIEHNLLGLGNGVLSSVFASRSSFLGKAMFFDLLSHLTTGHNPVS